VFLSLQCDLSPLNARIREIRGILPLRLSESFACSAAMWKKMPRTELEPEKSNVYLKSCILEEIEVA